jgi:redox-sensitive bicupin YhaK (pirin superfamily)
MNVADAIQPAAARKIERRTRGHRSGPVTRLMSPGDLGELLKPFVFLDLFDHEGPSFQGNLHPHSGIATLTYVMEGIVNYIDPDDVRGLMHPGAVEWMQAGRGMWHGGGIGDGGHGRTRGFQLWIALPPELELGPTTSSYWAHEDVPQHGPARVLLGRHGAAASAIEAPSPIHYLAVTLKAGERWRYAPPPGHTVLWTAVAKGSVAVPDVVRSGELVAFEHSANAVTFEAIDDSELVVGSAAPHEHALALGYYSVHTSPDALRQGEAHILDIRKALKREGRL